MRQPTAMAVTPASTRVRRIRAGARRARRLGIVSGRKTLRIDGYDEVSHSMREWIRTSISGMKLIAWLRLGTWLVCLTPLAWLCWHAVDGQLGPNPIQTLEYVSGRWALRLLLAALALHPLRRITGRPEPVRLRRLVGLWSYAYACLHFLVYLTFDIRFSPIRLGDDLVTHIFITAGFACWLMLLPLTVTSTRGWQRRLGRRWKVLHRLIYPAAVAGVLHYWWQVKSDEIWPLVYLGVLAALMLMRFPARTIWRGILHGRTHTALPTSE